MGAITVANTDSSILTAIKTTLTAATISGSSVFSEVDICGSREEFEQRKFKGTGAIATVIYLETTEHKSHDLVWGKVCRAEIGLAVREPTNASAPGAATRLVNACKNAIRATPPTGTKGFMSGGEEFYPRISFDEAEINTAGNRPWAISYLPVSIAYTINTSTSH